VEISAQIVGGSLGRTCTAISCISTSETLLALRGDISLAGPLEDQLHLTSGEPATIGTAMVSGHVVQ